MQEVKSLAIAAESVLVFCVIVINGHIVAYLM
jgi:hypothetical protein